MGKIKLSVLTTVVFVLLLSLNAMSQEEQESNSSFPIKALFLGPPKPADLDSYTQFIKEVLPKEGVNTLVVKFRYQYQFPSHPELAGKDALSELEVKKIVEACKEVNIKLIPKINCLGHQSGRESLFPLLEKYPEFDETPWVKMPDKFVWPNSDQLYCKSYCPEHPDLHKILFEIIDDLIDVCEADAFHVGMDEVFYIADSRCPRCSGQDPAVLFAKEVNRLHEHLTEKGVKMWMWGDRLLDGKTTGLGEWQASTSNTHKAIDMIPNDIIICDWHYDSAPPTAGYFALKGFDVIACPYHKEKPAIDQFEQVLSFKENANETTKSRYLGFMQTDWGNPAIFIGAYHGEPNISEKKQNIISSFRGLFAKIRENENQ